MQARKTDVVIVGGGPIGLANAWGFKLMNPNLKVVVLEKYQEYQRSHNLVMKHAELEKLMRATGTMEHPKLKKLLIQLKNNSRIRTNELEAIFKEVAIESGVEFMHEEVKPDTLQAQLFRDGQAPRLVIGADGTHSTISAACFGAGNQVKHEFDYVLQLRFEVTGDVKADDISTVQFYQGMARSGMIANEYVGRYDEAKGSTPVTMQMMISKESFEKLKLKATSKEPIKPFDTDEQKLDQLPVGVSNFLYGYLLKKIQNSSVKNQNIERSSVRVSVNEAPATHANEVFTHKSFHVDTVDHDVAVGLVGDAALGLSYFKGLNAGIESTAKMFTELAPAIKQGLEDPKELNAQYAKYQHWFLSIFAPKKVREVGKYSTWRINALWNIMSAVSSVKYVSQAEYEPANAETIRDYMRLLESDSIRNIEDSHKNQKVYPHRQYDPVRLGQWEYIDVRHTLKKTGKLFIDYFKPYKSGAQVAADFKQPLVGVVNILTGLVKIIAGIFTLNGKRLGDGILSLLRGAIEIATTPINWVVKPLVRGIATLIRGRPKIESNAGMKRIANQADKLLESKKGDNLSEVTESTYALLSFCNDLHRKFEKCVQRGQLTNVNLDEHRLYTQARTTMKHEHLKAYYSLFSGKGMAIPDMNFEPRPTSKLKN